MADLMWTSGCGCCRDRDAYDAAQTAVAAALHVPRYGDDSGWDFARFRTRTFSTGTLVTIKDARIGQRTMVVCPYPADRLGRYAMRNTATDRLSYIHPRDPRIIEVKNP